MTQTAAPTQVWVSVARAARILQKTPRQVRNYIEEGKLKSQRNGPLGWQMVLYDDVLKLATGNS